MVKRILVDAVHSEEVRLVVTNDGIIDEFDYQNLAKKTTQGNIYLGTVVRVEPSLQAVFINYGGDRNGFLPFSEIHPNYYNIPSEDKSSENKEESDNKETETEAASGNKKQSKQENKQENKQEAADEKEDGVILLDRDDDIHNIHASVAMHRDSSHHNYNVNEVIKRDQVILVQILKEERGNKGASLTSYISLVGRYCVFMPNSKNNSGISKKIDEQADRTRLKQLLSEFNEKYGDAGSVVIRTAGSQKTKIEIRRDFDYLHSLWDNIRKHTLASNAPAFIYEDGDIIKKAIRDLYYSEVEEVLIEGKDAYENAQKFMKLVLPRHVVKVKEHKGKVPIFVDKGIEEQIVSLYSSVVHLKSGGYIVINTTEALVAVDVNSGRSTAEKDIESTALKTNLEAAETIAQQLRLRDIGGLIVIDFIDMSSAQHRKNVEKAFKSCLSGDKAKIRTSSITMFGLLEMSRQRIKQSLIEGTTETCFLCEGHGRVRSINATAAALLRAIERELMAQRKGKNLRVTASKRLISYMFNNKRNEITSMENNYDTKIILDISNEVGGDKFIIELEDDKLSQEIQPLASMDKDDYYQDNRFAKAAVTPNETDGDANEKNNEKPKSGKSSGGGNSRRDNRASDNQNNKSGTGNPYKKKYNEQRNRQNEAKQNKNHTNKQSDSFLKSIWKTITK